MRHALAVLTAMFVMAIGGTVFILWPGPWFWFRAGLGVLMYGGVLRHLALSRFLVRMRQRLGLSMVQGMRLWCGAYIVAAGLFTIGAMMSLDEPFAAIVAFAAFSWGWMWTWVLWQSGSWDEPSTVPPSDQDGRR